MNYFCTSNWYFQTLKWKIWLFFIVPNFTKCYRSFIVYFTVFNSKTLKMIVLLTLLFLKSIWQWKYIPHPHQRILLLRQKCSFYIYCFKSTVFYDIFPRNYCIFLHNFIEKLILKLLRKEWSLEILFSTIVSSLKIPRCRKIFLLLIKLRVLFHRLSGVLCFTRTHSLSFSQGSKYILYL